MTKKEQDKRYYEKNRVKLNKKNLEYYYQNRDSIRLKQNVTKKYRYKNDSMFKMKTLNKQRADYVKYNEKKLMYMRGWREKVRLDVLKFVGGEKGLVCIKCGFSDIKALQIDHVNGGGRKELRELSFDKNNKQYLEHIKKNPIGYQLLCANCNWIKKVDNNEVKRRKLFNENNEKI